MNKSDITRDYFMLKGPLEKKGYDWWWHNFTGYNHETKEEKSFFIEYFICNPALGGDKAILGQLTANKKRNKKPSYALIKVGTWVKVRSRFITFIQLQVSHVQMVYWM